MKSLGGDTVGVVERGSTKDEKYQKPEFENGFSSIAYVTTIGILPFEDVLFNFCLKSASIVLGNVVPRSQMSRSLIILCYYTETYVSPNYTNVRGRKSLGEPAIMPVMT